MGLSYEESKKLVFKGLILLGVVTLVEVFISLLAKGYVIPGLDNYVWLAYVAGLVLIGLSLFKAYYIVFEFMHMRYEAKGLAMTVLLPTLLLVWALIAFFQEGDSWGDRRELIKEKDAEKVQVSEKGEEKPKGIYPLESVEKEQ